MVERLHEDKMKRKEQNVIYKTDSRQRGTEYFVRGFDYSRLNTKDVELGL